MSKQSVDKRRIVIGPVRLSYCYIAEPRENKGDGENDYNDEPSYSTQILIPKSDKATRKKLAAAIIEGAKKKFGGKAEKMLKSSVFKKPLRDPEEEDREGAEYIDMLFANVNQQAKRGRPGVALRDGTKLTDTDTIAEEIYSGVWVKISVTAFGFSGKSKGVALALNNVMKWKDDDRLDGGMSVSDEFEDEFDNEFSNDSSKSDDSMDDDDDWDL